MLTTQIASSKKENGYEMVTLDVDEPIKPSTVDSPLIRAARIGDLGLLCSALDKGSHLTEVGEGGGTALHWASNNVNFDAAIACVEELIRRALLSSNSSLLQTVLDLEDKLQQSAIFWATAKGNDRLVRILLNNGAKLKINFDKETLFHLLVKADPIKAEKCGAILLELKYYDNDPIKLCGYLDVEQEDTKYTALQLATIEGYSKLMEMLIRGGADVNKVDCVGRNVFHRAAGNVYDDKAIECTKVLLQENLQENWNKKVSQMLNTSDSSGKCPVHLAARRGFDEILSLLPQTYDSTEAKTGYTVLHAAASLGNQYKAEKCVEVILNNLDPAFKEQILNAKDANGCTPLYLAAENRNIRATEILLLAGSGFDIKTNRGKTPLEKVYEKIPQAVNVLLKEAAKNSGYVEHIDSVNTHAELDFGPILGYSTEKDKSNVYKETEELAKVCYAKFEDRKEILDNTFIKIYIHEKWQRIRWFFIVFRILHILWFLCNFFLIVSIYRVNCPTKDAKMFSWTNLRPAEDEADPGDKTKAVQKSEVDDNNTETKNLNECKTITKLYICGILNMCALLFYFVSQFHVTKQRLHWIFRPMKPFQSNINPIRRFFYKIGYYTCICIRILPCWPIFLGTLIFITNLPILGILIFKETTHYIIAGTFGLLIWLAIYMELGKFPKFRVYINLLMRSTKTLLLAILVTAPILCGFATVFVVLMPGEPSFSSATQSFVKVITFMIGELDYEGLFYGEGKGNIFSGFVMLVLAIFIVIIVVLLVNFLIGLAAEEIHDFWKRAEIWKLCTQLEQIVMLESFLDESITCCGRGFLKRNLMLMPPLRENEKVVQQRRRAIINIPNLPQKLQKELHELNLRTIAKYK